MMVKCIDCFHFGACKGVKAANEIVDTHSDTEPIMCDFFESQSSITGKTNALWVENRPNEDVMSQFVKLGIARGMSSKSTFWTCSNCGSWGSLNKIKESDPDKAEKLKQVVVNFLKEFIER